MGNNCTGGQQRIAGLSVSDQMRSIVGRPFAQATSAPITLADVRRWERAVLWPLTPEPRDPTNDSVPLEFNPFASSLDTDGPQPDGDRPDSFIEELAGVPGPGSTSGLNGELDVTYGVPMRIGDVISKELLVIDYRIRQGSAGMLLLTDVETEWRNQKGAVVLVQRNTTVRS